MTTLSIIMTIHNIVDVDGGVNVGVANADDDVVDGYSRLDCMF